MRNSGLDRRVYAARNLSLRHALDGLRYTAAGIRPRDYRIHLVDRVGGGDSFTAGLLYGMLKGFDPQHTLDFATAASCLKQTIEQDFNLSFADEIELVASGEATGRIRR